MNMPMSRINVVDALARHPLVMRGRRALDWLNRALTRLAPPVDLLVRLWVAEAFFRSGLTKIASFDSTVLLFTYEYQVPLLPPYWAALSATAAELVLPVLLVLGLFGRLPALGLFFVNIVAVISYPALEGAALREHHLWGLLLAVTLVHGPGALNLDRLLTWLRSR